MRQSTTKVVMIIAAVATWSSAAFAEKEPTLNFERPIGFIAIGGELFLPNSTHSISIKIVHFRPFRGKSLDQEAQTTLMREWERSINHELRFLVPPKHERVAVAGAGEALMTVFYEDYFGTRRKNLRLAMVAAQSLATVYVEGDVRAWDHYQRSLGEFLASVKVGFENDVAAPRTKTFNQSGRSIAGFYLETGLRWQVGSYVPAKKRFYLFSGDGRMYRGWGLPNVPDGDIRRFDYRRARQTDPDNTGAYEVKGNRLVITFPGRGPIKVELDDGEVLKIDGTEYELQIGPGR